MSLLNPRDVWIRGLLIKHFFYCDKHHNKTHDKPLWAVVNQKNQVLAVSNSKSEARRHAIWIINIKPELVMNSNDSLGEYINNGRDDWTG